MSSLWPWLTVAGLGALHGMNPATGWLFAAAWGVRSRDRVQALWALMPIAIGHAASVALIAAAVALGLSMDRAVVQAAPAREISASRSLALALAAVGVHTVTMLAVTGAIATGVCRGFESAAGLLRQVRVNGR